VNGDTEHRISQKTALGNGSRNRSTRRAQDAAGGTASVDHDRGTFARYLLSGITFVTAASISPTLAWQTSVTTADGLNWLEAAPFTSSGDGINSVTVDATGLLTGTYHGTVTVFDPGQPLVIR
jgi:hypothetical protein